MADFGMRELRSIPEPGRYIIRQGLAERDLPTSPRRRAATDLLKDVMGILNWGGSLAAARTKLRRALDEIDVIEMEERQDAPGVEAIVPDQTL